jgi:hypothetical protein
MMIDDGRHRRRNSKGSTHHFCFTHINPIGRQCSSPRRIDFRKSNSGTRPSNGLRFELYTRSHLEGDLGSKRMNFLKRKKDLINFGIRRQINHEKKELIEV